MAIRGRKFANLARRFNFVQIECTNTEKWREITNFGVLPLSHTHTHTRARAKFRDSCSWRRRRARMIAQGLGIVLPFPLSLSLSGSLPFVVPFT